jgi:predicted GNAT family acetyltransferase
MSIRQHDTSTKGEFVLEINGVEQGRLHYSWAGLNTVIINHTEVYPAFENRGNGLALVEAVVEFARTRKINIIPRCSFASEMFRQHPDWKDVLWKS